MTKSRLRLVRCRAEIRDWQLKEHRKGNCLVLKLTGRVYEDQEKIWADGDIKTFTNPTMSDNQGVYHFGMWTGRGRYYLKAYKITRRDVNGVD